ncbi:DUF6283 family protein [Nonomuraea sp. LPB2021202275-12-8]|uniref:DUF6283 family protein n=1 Tax=Nonomuraea sp. LPB2021202275-12-8 TaxID=3120159 RepID=UPI00300BFFD4
MSNFPHRRFPCGPCPWKRTATPGEFPAERYVALRATCPPDENGFPPPPGTPMFGCHVGEPGTGEDLACAGWLAVEGFEHLGVRVALSDGRIDPTALEPGLNWPDLYDSYEELAAANGAMLAVHGERSP